MKRLLPQIIFSSLCTLIFAIVLRILIKGGLFFKVDLIWCNSCSFGYCTEMACAPRYIVNYPSLLLLVPIFILFIVLYRLLNRKLNMSKITFLIVFVVCLLVGSYWYYTSWRRTCRAATYKPNLPFKDGQLNCPEPLSPWTWSE